VSSQFGGTELVEGYIFDRTGRCHYPHLVWASTSSAECIPGHRRRHGRAARFVCNIQAQTSAQTRDSRCALFQNSARHAADFFARRFGNEACVLYASTASGKKAAASPRATGNCLFIKPYFRPNQSSLSNSLRIGPETAIPQLRVFIAPGREKNSVRTVAIKKKSPHSSRRPSVPRKHPRRSGIQHPPRHCCRPPSAGFGAGGLWAQQASTVISECHRSIPSLSFRLILSDQHDPEKFRMIMPMSANTPKALQTNPEGACAESSSCTSVHPGRF